MPDSLFLEERRRVILEHLQQEGRATVKDLSELMQVSAATIRQDLRALEARDIIERTYGGAVYKGGPASLKELSFNVRLTKMREEKLVMVSAAAALVQEGAGIALDCSTTVYLMVPHLKRYSKLTIVTNGLLAAQQFLDERTAHVLIAGGRLRADSISAVGQPDSIPNINLNIGFFSCRGLTPGIGATEVDGDETQMKRALMARCIHHVFMVDSSKWGEVAPYTIAASTELQHIITVEGAPEDQIAQFRAMGVQVDVLPRPA